MSALARSAAQTSVVLALRILTQGAILVASARLLGPEGYGSYVSATALAVVLGIIPCLGSGYVMLARSELGPKAVNEVWNYAWPLALAMGLVLGALYVPAAFALGGKHPLSHAVLFVIAATELVIAPIGTLLSNTLQAVHRVPLSQLALWASLALRAIFMCPFFFRHSSIDILMFVALQAIAAILGLALTAILAQRHVALNIRPRFASLSELRQGGSYSFMHFTAANSSELDKVVAASALGSHDAGIYGAAARVVGASLMPISALLLSAQPQLFQYRKKSRGELVRLLSALGGFAFAWGGISWAVLSAASHLVASVLGPEYARVADFLPWLAGVAAPLALRTSAGTILVALGQPATRIVLELIGTFALVCLMGLLGPRFGIIGMAMALGSVELSMAVVGWWIVTRIVTN